MDPLLAGAGGINPDKDVTLITIPPPQMVANMKVGKMDGFCVGEPWPARAIADGIGFTAITTQQIWRDHPEKVLGFTEEFAEKNPKTVGPFCGPCLNPASTSTGWKIGRMSPKWSRVPSTSTRRRRSSWGGCWGNTITETDARSSRIRTT